VTDFHNETVDVQKSGAFYDTADGKLTAFYKAAAGFGGIQTAHETGAPAYADWNWSNYSDFDDVITGEFVYDFFFWDQDNSPDPDNIKDYAYFATKLGTFRMDKALVDSVSGEDDFFTEVDFFEIKDGDNNVLTVFGLAYLETDKIILATDGGVFTADLDNDTPLANLAVVDGTEGKKFTTIAASTDGSYSAAVTDTALYLFDHTGASVDQLPLLFAAGYPGLVSELTFMDDNVTLLISGEGDPNFTPGGLASLNVQSMF
jgi:hypothetical protein